MKYVGTQKAGHDGKTDVYVFTMGREEVKVVHDLINEARTKTPRTVETNPFRNRLRNIIAGFSDALRQMGWKKSNHHYEL